MAQKTGRVTIKSNGTAFASKAGATLRTGGVRREGEMSDQGDFFYIETLEAAEVSFTLIHTSDTDLEAIRAMRDVTIEFECDTGRAYTIANACFKSDEGLTNGEVRCLFGGAPARQH